MIKKESSRYIVLFVFLLLSSYLYAQIDTIEIPFFDEKKWELDSAGLQGNRMKVYFESLDDRGDLIIDHTAGEVIEKLGLPNDDMPVNEGMPFREGLIQRMFSYYLYDSRFRVIHEYRLYFCKDKVSKVRFIRGGY